MCYNLKGDPNSALGYAFKSLEIQKKRDHADLMAGSLTMFALASVLKGDIISSIKYGNQALSIAGLKNTWKYMCYITLGKAHIEKGELDTALKYYDKCFDFSKVMGYTHAALALEWLRIGSIHVMKGDLNKALEIYKRSLEISEKINFSYLTSQSLLYLVSIYLDKKMLDEAQEYLLKLKEFADQTGTPLNSQSYKLAKALILKTSGRTRKRAEAETLLKQIVEGEVIHIDLFIKSLVSLCDYLLEELEINNDPEVLDELNPVITRLLEMAKEHHSYSLLAETNLLKGRLALFQLNLNEARQHLTAAQKIAEENGLSILAQKISQEHDNLLEELETWRSLKKTQASISKRMKLASIDEVLDRMQRKRAIELLEFDIEEPILLLIMDQSGVPYFNHSFGSDWDIDGIFSSFMSAFNTFSSELFERLIDRIKIGDNTILINPVESFLVCYVIKGQSYPAQQKLSRFSETIKSTEEIWDALNRAAKTSEMLELDNPPSLGNTVNEIFIS
jgi:tetratricopeptide (TPR) repeat protein